MLVLKEKCLLMESILLCCDIYSINISIAVRHNKFLLNSSVTAASFGRVEYHQAIWT